MGIALAAALAIHVTLVLLLDFMVEQTGSGNALPSLVEFDIRPSLPPGTPAATARTSEPAERIAEPEEKPDEVKGTELPVGQIVTIAPALPEQMPDSARFAARYAQKVEREVKARFPSKNQVPPDVVGPIAQPRTAPAPRLGTPDGDRNAATGGLAGQGAPGSGGPGSGGTGMDGAPPGDLGSGAPGQGSQGTGATGTGGTGNAGSGAGSTNAYGTPGGTEDGLALLSTPMQGLDPASKYSPSVAPFASDDYLPSVEETGDENLLNTIPYRYIGFFERVKHRVKQQWDPNTPYRRRDPGGQLYGHKDRLTVISVVLDENGNILDTRVTDTSGLSFLDEEAVRAFWAAGPFSNPPSALVGDDRRIRFDFGFAFLVATSRHSFFWRF